MRTIGIFGGSTICDLGPASDVQAFFDCIKAYAEQERPDQDWSLLTDRLYRRYLRLEELDRASSLMNQVREIFSRVSSKEVVRLHQDIFGGAKQTWFDASKGTLASMFGKYFDSFSMCVESARLNYEAFKSYPGYRYEPVRIGVSDIPALYKDGERPLTEYEALEEGPYWSQ